MTGSPLKLHSLKVGSMSFPGSATWRNGCHLAAPAIALLLASMAVANAGSDSSREEEKVEGFGGSEFLQLIRSKDASFNNISVSLEQSRSEMIDVRGMLRRLASAAGREIASQYDFDAAPPIPEQPFQGEIIHDVSVVIRDSELTLRRTLISDPRTSWLIGPYSKSEEVVYSTTTGIKRLASESRDGSWHLTQTTAPVKSSDPLVKLRDRIRLCLGYGWGALLQEVTSVNTVADESLSGTTLTGIGSMYGNDVSEFKLWYDHALNFRRADVSMRYPTHLNQLSVVSEGLLDGCSVPLPLNASWSRSLVDESGSQVRNLEQRAFRVVSADVNLTDAEYREMSVFLDDAQFATIVEMNPEIRDKNHTRIGESPLLADGNSSAIDRVRILLLVNAIAVLVVLPFFLRRTLQSMRLRFLRRGKKI